MAHDPHFLERLSRVSVGQTERAGVGDQAERVAIALEEGTGSPHLLVSRDGGFVTSRPDADLEERSDG
jgi:hypothetical protein